MNMAIANVCRVDLLPEDGGAALHTLTAEEAGCEARLSEGAETPLRSKNRILALNATEDLVIGYTLTLRDLTIDPDAFALLDGGTVTWDEAHERFAYAGPRTGEAAARRAFTCDVWTEEKDGDGETIGYQRFRFPHCKGAPVSFRHRDGGFFAPEYRLKNRPALGRSAVEIHSFSALPAANGDAAALLAYTGGIA